ncbi:MAG: CusA/CzcA family heavy metal efflux RND transporter [Gemmataceae bacterium]
MLAILIAAAFRLRWVVLIMTLAVVGVGVWSFQQMPVDAYPDISAQMVQVITVFPGRAPEEVERQVTIPVENAMLGLPRVESVRSRTIFGLSLVQMTFEEGTEAYWARQRVAERLGELELPEGVQPELGALATAYGEIYRYQLVADEPVDLIELRTLNDWVVIRRLMQVPGVAEVSNFGGYEKQFAIIFDPSQLQQFDLTLDDIEEAITRNNAAGGGSIVRQGGTSMVVRGKGQIETVSDIENLFIKSVAGTPLYLKDVGTVGIDHQVPNGIFSKDATDASVAGIVLMRKGENPSEVLRRVQEAVQQLNETAMPDGVRIVPYYDRSHLIEATFDTVAHSVSLGITLVVLVLIFFLGRPMMALLVALTIPFSLLFALILMHWIDIPIGLLSIGAIDFGIIVDGSVIMAENIARRLGEAKRREPGEMASIIQAAALDMHRPVFVSVSLIMVAFLPLLSLTRIEGLLFRPMALTILFALLGALLFALFIVPVLATVLFRHGYTDWKNPLLRLVEPAYARLLRGLLRMRWIIATASIGVLVIVMALILPRLGTEFLPYLDEGVIWVRVNFPEGTALEQTSEYGRRLRELALTFPDIDFVVVQAGRNDDGTDPFPPSRIEMMIGPKPRAHWKEFQNKQDLVAALGERYREEFPTTKFNFTQPIIDSVTEDTNGTSANLAVEFSGPDADTLLDLARRTVTLLGNIPGATDVNIEQEGPQPQLLIEPDRLLCARYNVQIEDVMQLVNMAIGGEAIGTLYDGDRRFDIVARLDPAARGSLYAIRRLPVYSVDGLPIPLEQVATVEVIDGQTIIARDNGQRAITVRCDIVGRDQGGFVKEATERFAETITVPHGYRVQWLGMFENLDRAYQHFRMLIPVTFTIVFLVLYWAFGSIRAALVLLMPVPFAVASGAVALYLRDMHLNVSTGVGFATLFGIAIMDAVLMFKGITSYRLQGVPLENAIVQGRLDRLRPGLMTASVAILGLLPASLATGLGSDVQRPLATVIVWGLVGSTCFTLIVTPVWYRIFVPPLPQARTAEPRGLASRIMEPLPDALPRDTVALLEYLASQDGESDVFQITDRTNQEFERVIANVQAAKMLGFVETPSDMVILTAKGRDFVNAMPPERAALWREQLLGLRLFRDVHDVLRRQPQQMIDRDFVLEIIVTRLPYENFERIFNTFVRWARYGKLFHYDEETQRVILHSESST